MLGLGAVGEGHVERTLLLARMQNGLYFTIAIECLPSCRADSVLLALRWACAWPGRALPGVCASSLCAGATSPRPRHDLATTSPRPRHDLHRAPAHRIPARRAPAHLGLCSARALCIRMPCPRGFSPSVHPPRPTHATCILRVHRMRTCAHLHLHLRLHLRLHLHALGARRRAASSSRGAWWPTRPRSCIGCCRAPPRCSSASPGCNAT